MFFAAVVIYPFSLSYNCPLIATANVKIRTVGYWLWVTQFHQKRFKFEKKGLARFVISKIV